MHHIHGFEGGSSECDVGTSLRGRLARKRAHGDPRLRRAFFERGFVQVKGKGGKERIVPLGEHAIKAVKAWLPYRRKSC